MHDMGGADVAAIGWDDADSPLVPDCLAPGQLDRRGRTDLEQGWRHLMACVLESALRDLSHSSPEVRADAFRFFAHPYAPTTVNLHDACVVLGLSNPQRISRRALRWAGLA
jgi:hypothetical protein